MARRGTGAKVLKVVMKVVESLKVVLRFPSSRTLEKHPKAIRKSSCVVPLLESSGDRSLSLLSADQSGVQQQGSVVAWGPVPDIPQSGGS